MFKFLDDVRFRYIFMIVGLLSWLIVTLITGENGFVSELKYGAVVVSTLTGLTKIFLYLAALHISRRGLLDYADFEELLNTAKTTAQGSGCALIAIAIYVLAISLIITQVI